MELFWNWNTAQSFGLFHIWMNWRGQSMCSTLPWNEQSNGCVHNLHRVMHLACLDSRRDFSFNNPSLFPVFLLNWWPLCWLLRSRRDHIPTKSVEVIPPCEKKKKTLAELSQNVFKGCEITCMCICHPLGHTQSWGHWRSRKQHFGRCWCRVENEK